MPTSQICGTLLQGCKVQRSAFRVHRIALSDSTSVMLHYIQSPYMSHHTMLHLSDVHTLKIMHTFLPARHTHTVLVPSSSSESKISTMSTFLASFGSSCDDVAEQRSAKLNPIESCLLTGSVLKRNAMLWPMRCLGFIQGVGVGSAIPLLNTAHCCVRTSCTCWSC